MDSRPSLLPQPSGRAVCAVPRLSVVHELLLLNFKDSVLYAFLWLVMETLREQCKPDNECGLSRDRGEWRSAGDTARLAPSWLYTFGLHLREAQVRLPRQPGTQVLVAFLWVYTMIVTIAYSTNLTAFLLVKKLPASIETLEQLSQSSLKVAGVGELFMTELQEASDPNVKSLAKKFEEQSSKQEAYQKVLAGEAMFVENRGYVEFVAKIKYSRGGESRMRVMKGNNDKAALHTDMK
ncbi:hypothetical protein E2C01_029116 [Portunus trituberculatus]|uniref:Ionotropic glutamate receptor C-terminal domain-containing protein n=1 Tax=Portunus trituberculatus TaxID=210409 RepID=A0A5B7ER08_PORTR|nr:hypothetical protein [Portunus trituberculatus]